MNLRRDALVAAARTVDSVRRAADALAAEGGDYFVATVGILDISPSASSVVPSQSRLIVDARSTSPEMTRRFVERIDRESTDHARAAGVSRTRFAVLSDGPPAACDPALRAELRHAAQRLGFSARDVEAAIRGGWVFAGSESAGQ
jgi:N-carbamoyl-L-amino-acid hydrolase